MGRVKQCRQFRNYIMKTAPKVGFFCSKHNEDISLFIPCYYYFNYRVQNGDQPLHFLNMSKLEREKVRYLTCIISL